MAPAEGAQAPDGDEVGHGRTTRRSLLRQERSRATRRLLIRTAARLWGERGYDDVTVEEICTVAGVGRTTFYLHFDSKEQLLGALGYGTAMGVAADLAAMGGEEDLRARLEVFVGGLVRRMEDVPKSLAELAVLSYRMRSPRGYPPDVRFADMLRDLLTEADARGELAPGADPVELGEILGALTIDAIESWSLREAVEPSLGSVLRFRFGLVLERYLSPATDCGSDGHDA